MTKRAALIIDACQMISYPSPHKLPSGFTNTLVCMRAVNMTF